MTSNFASNRAENAFWPFLHPLLDRSGVFDEHVASRVPPQRIPDVQSEDEPWQETRTRLSLRSSQITEHRLAKRVANERIKRAIESSLSSFRSRFAARIISAIPINRGESWATLIARDMVTFRGTIDPFDHWTRASSMHRNAVRVRRRRCRRVSMTDEYFSRRALKREHFIFPRDANWDDRAVRFTN